jgi:hypothetical protein
LTPEQAIDRQREVVRDVVRHPCGRPGTPEEILVCGVGDRSVPERRQGSGLRPEDEWEAPAEGPWFSWSRGPLTLSCCSVRGQQGSGAGLGLRIAF